jgi:hypothetical protein
MKRQQEISIPPQFIFVFWSQLFPTCLQSFMLVFNTPPPGHVNALISSRTLSTNTSKVPLPPLHPPLSSDLTGLVRCEVLRYLRYLHGEEDWEGELRFGVLLQTQEEWRGIRLQGNRPQPSLDISDAPQVINVNRINSHYLRKLHLEIAIMKVPPPPPHPPSCPHHDATNRKWTIRILSNSEASSLAKEPFAW